MHRAPLLVVRERRCIGEVLPISPLPKLAGMTPTPLGSRRHQKQLSTCEPAEMATAVAGVKRQARAYQCVSCDRSYPKHFKVGLARKVPDAFVLLQRGMPRAHPQASDMCDVCHSLFKRAKPMPLQVGAAATRCSSTAAPNLSARAPSATPHKAVESLVSAIAPLVSQLQVAAEDVWMRERTMAKYSHDCVSPLQTKIESVLNSLPAAAQSESQAVCLPDVFPCTGASPLMGDEILSMEVRYIHSA